MGEGGQVFWDILKKFRWTIVLSFSIGVMVPVIVVNLVRIASNDSDGLGWSYQFLAVFYWMVSEPASWISLGKPGASMYFFWFIYGALLGIAVDFRRSRRCLVPGAILLVFIGLSLKNAYAQVAPPRRAFQALEFAQSGKMVIYKKGSYIESGYFRVSQGKRFQEKIEFPLDLEKLKELISYIKAPFMVAPWVSPIRKYSCQRARAYPVSVETSKGRVSLNFTGGCWSVMGVFEGKSFSVNLNSKEVYLERFFLANWPQIGGATLEVQEKVND